MANRTIENNADQFMPEYWPANKLIGVLEHVLVEAKNIIGELTSDQIQGLVTSKLIGKLTNEQIEEIAAAKISGQLTSAQIKELEAAKIAGQLVDSQIKELAVGKLKGVLSSSQIESLEATKITGELTGAQIKELATAKLVGQISHAQIAAEAVSAINIAALSITAEKIAVESITAEKLQAGSVSANKLAASSVTAEKIAVEAVEASKIAALAVTTVKLAAEAVTAGKISAGAVTTEKILAEAVTAIKIAAGSITTAKLAASAVTAEKIAVGSLSAISANLGVVTAGEITGVKINSLSSFVILTKESALAANTLEWQETEGPTRQTIAGLWQAGLKQSSLRLDAYAEQEISKNKSRLLLTALNKGITESDRKGTSVTAVAGPGETAPEALIIDGLGQSKFLQLPTVQNRRISFGTATTSQTAGSRFLNEKEVEHELGIAPKVVVAVSDNAAINIATKNYTEKKFKLAGYNAFGTEGIATINIWWIAMG